MIQAVSPDQVRRITADVLRGPEFQKSFDPWQAALEWIRQWFGKLAQWASENPDSARMLAIALTIVLAFFLAHIVYTVGKEYFVLRRRSDSSAENLRSMKALEGIADNWAEAFRLAKAALEAGDLYRALWITHRLLLSALDRRDLLRFARWKTNSDYLRECRAGEAAAAALADVSAAYERVIYAHSDINHEQAARLLARVEAYVNEASR